MNKQKLYQNRNWLEYQYINKKKSQPQIAKEYNIGFGCVRYQMKKFNIPIRSESYSVHLAKANHCNLSQEAREWIEGELLGDGNLGSRNIHSSLYHHGSKFKEYILYVSKTLNSFGIRQMGKICEIYHKDINCYTYSYSSLYYPELLPIYKRWYPKGKKIVPRDIKLTPLTCRQWYIGDGCLQHPKNARPYIQLSTDCFTIDEINWLRNKLKKLGFKTTRPKCANRIRISVYSVKDFLDYIGSCPIKCYQYKWRI